MQFSRTGLRFGLFGVLSLGAWAGTVTDPQMAMEEGAFSNPIFVGASFEAQNGGGQFGFFNPTGQFITAVGFETTLNSRIPFGEDDTPSLAETFQCNTATNDIRPNPYFQSCTFTYNFLSGALDVRFFDPVPIPSTVGLGGIPPLPPGCSDTPDEPPCTLSGHFGVILNDRFAGDPDQPPPASGGWSFARNPDLFPDAPVVFTVTEVSTATPEPSTLALLAGAALLFAGRSRLRCYTGDDVLPAHLIRRG